MAAIDEPAGHALSIREAAAACRLSPRTIRRKLTAGTFPNAFETEASEAPADGRWRIPIADLETAGLSPTLIHPTLLDAIEKTASDAVGPTVLELVKSDRFGRLRTELAEAVAAAELALLRAEAERWRVIADERGKALDRADRALKALTTAITANAGGLGAPRAAPGNAEAYGDGTAVPPNVREEAMRFSSTLKAMQDLRHPPRWWQFWR